MHYFPIGTFLFLVFWMLLAMVFVLFQIGVLRHVFAILGVNRRYVFALLVLSLLGSYINIPVATLPAKEVHSGQIINFFGMQYVVPTVVDWPRTVIAVNVGGAIIPFILSVYLILKHKQFFKSLLAVAIMAWIVHQMARPVPGVGIAVPVFVPPSLAALIAVLISRQYAAPLAYIGGSLGTLIGADLLNLNKIQGLGAPVASIGGAGKFDGIFLTGLIAVLLAGIISRWTREPEPPVQEDFREA